MSPAGFEPTAPGLGILCSILLSYGDAVPPFITGALRLASRKQAISFEEKLSLALSALLLAAGRDRSDGRSCGLSLQKERKTFAFKRGSKNLSFRALSACVFVKDLRLLHLRGSKSGPSL